jgi:hypothetical protein
MWFSEIRESTKEVWQRWEMRSGSEGISNLSEMVTESYENEQAGGPKRDGGEGKEEAEGPVTGRRRLIWYYRGRTACAVERVGVDVMTLEELGILICRSSSDAWP